jgi:serine protease Do
MGGLPHHTLHSLRHGMSHLIAVLVIVSAFAASAQPRSLDEIASAVVRVKAYIEPDARTAATLGREREGSGVIIDNDGLVLTIGYLMVEARAVEIGTLDGRTVPATVVGYDHETGLGLLRALVPLKTAPLGLGRSADLKHSERVLVASFGGAQMAALAHVEARREFAGSWEYLLDDAIFTAPPHPAWSGAALINRDGKLVGIGSLVVGDVGDNKGPGNMFVPIDLLAPIMADLIDKGRVSRPARPWLGLTVNEAGGDLLIERVVPDSPAARAKVPAGAKIVGVNGHRPASLGDLYRKIWAQGFAGTIVSLEISHDNEVRQVEITSMNRLDHLRLKSSL